MSIDPEVLGEIVLWARIGIAIPTFPIMTWAITMNWATLIRHLIGSAPRDTVQPLVGGICGAIALLAVPVPFYNLFFWVPLVIDPGSIPWLLYTGIGRIFSR